MYRLPKLLTLCTIFIMCGVTSCSIFQNTKNSTPLKNTRWRLMELNNININDLKVDKDIFFTLKENSNSINGFSGCNRLTGTYAVEENKKRIKIESLAFTKMSCPHISIEKAFINALDQANNYKIDNNNLYLYSGTNLLAKLEATYL